MEAIAYTIVSVYLVWRGIIFPFVIRDLICLMEWQKTKYKDPYYVLYKNSKSK